MLDRLNTRESVRFGEELARELLAVLAGSSRAGDAKFKARMEKALVQAGTPARERLNFYEKACRVRTRPCSCWNSGSAGQRAGSLPGRPIRSVRFARDSEAAVRAEWARYCAARSQGRAAA